MTQRGQDVVAADACVSPDGLTTRQLVMRRTRSTPERQYAALLLLLLLVGPGVGYGPLYLSHLLIFLAVPFVVRRWLRSRSEWCFVMPAVIWAALLLVYVVWRAIDVRSSEMLAMHAAMVGLSLLSGVAAAACVRALGVRRTIACLAFFIALLTILSIIESALGWRLPVSRFSANGLDAVLADMSDRLLQVPTGFYGNQNNLALICVLLIPLCALFERRMTRNCAVGSLAVITLLSESRFGLLGLGLSLIALPWITGRRLRLGMLAAAGVAIALIVWLMTEHCSAWFADKICVAIGYARERPDLASIALAGDSIGVRVDLWMQALAQIERHPALGIGPGQSALYLSAEHYQAGTIVNPHNPVLEILLEYGLVGGLLWAVGYAELLRRAAGECANRSGRAALAVLCILPIAAPAISSLYYFTPAAAIVGLVMGVASCYRQRESYGKTFRAIDPVWRAV